MDDGGEGLALPPCGVCGVHGPLWGYSQNDSCCVMFVCVCARARTCTYVHVCRRLVTSALDAARCSTAEVASVQFCMPTRHSRKRRHRRHHSKRVRARPCRSSPAAEGALCSFDRADAVNGAQNASDPGVMQLLTVRKGDTIVSVFHTASAEPSTGSTGPDPVTAHARVFMRELLDLFLKHHGAAVGECERGRPTYPPPVRRVAARLTPGDAQLRWTTRSCARRSGRAPPPTSPSRSRASSRAPTPCARRRCACWRTGRRRFPRPRPTRRAWRRRRRRRAPLNGHGAAAGTRAAPYRRPRPPGCPPLSTAPAGRP